MIEKIIDAEEIIELAYTDAPYRPTTTIAESTIIAAEQRYLTPVIGEELLEAVASGSYTTLYSDYIAPTVAEYVRYLLTPRGDAEREVMFQRARAQRWRLHLHLQDNESLYAEYDSSMDILNRCRLNGGFVQIY